MGLLFSQVIFPRVKVSEGMLQQGSVIESCPSSLLVPQTAWLCKVEEIVSLWTRGGNWEGSCVYPKAQLFVSSKCTGNDAKIHPFYTCRYLIFITTCVHKNMRKLHRHSWALCNPLYYCGRNVDVVICTSSCPNPSCQASELYTQGSQIKHWCMSSWGGV